MASPVRVAFLGGLGEIGRNCAAIEVDGRIMLIDCGLMFPDDDMAGVDLVLPDFSYLRDNAHRVEGVVATHGNEKITYNTLERSYDGACRLVLRPSREPVRFSRRPTPAVARSPAWERPTCAAPRAPSRSTPTIPRSRPAPCPAA